MTELLDGDQNKLKDQTSTLRLLNTIVLILSFVIIPFTIWKVWSTKETLTSPWLPVYTVYYINGALINFTVILSFGIFPALFLRFLKLYGLSTACIGLFMLAGFLFRNTSSFYWDVMKMMN